jgi:hypothetical protein
MADVLKGYDNKGREVTLSVPFEGGQLSCAMEGNVSVHKIHYGEAASVLSWTHIRDSERQLWTRNCTASPMPVEAVCMVACDGSKWWRVEEAEQ